MTPAGVATRPARTSTSMQHAAYFLTFATLALAGAPAQQQATYRATTQAEQDPALSALSGGAMLAIPGLLTDFVIAGGGQFVELPDGTARLTARIHSESSLYSAFLVDLTFSGRSAPGSAGYPPAGSPELLMLPSAYQPSGPVDPSTFVYYTAASGTLTGSLEFDGAVIAIQLGSQAAQLGAGANNRNGEAGLSAHLQLTVLQQPALPFGTLTSAELSCDLPPSRTDDATHPQVDPTRSTLPFGRALTLPGAGDDYVFVPAGQITEHEDGLATVTGRLARLSQLDDAWDVSLALTGRVDPGEAAHPPGGSPVLQMMPSAYTGNGGTIDPSHWRYYTVATGTLTGVGLNAGGSIALSNTTAAQVGVGANQTNTFHGCYCGFAPTVTTQPTNHTVTLTGDAELFVLGARFPVLPFPTLNVPSTPYTLPTLTDQGIVLAGDNLAWVELVATNSYLAAIGDERDWFRGWIRVIDNQHLEFHPRPGLAPGIYDVRALNPAVVSNLLQLTLTAPATPVLFAEPAVGANDVLHLMVHKGATPLPALSLIAASFTLAPTVFPGVTTIDIGAQGADLFVLPGSFGHQPTTGIARFDTAPTPPWFTGVTMHFQAVTVDLGNLTLPLPATNTWTVDYL